MVVIKKPRQLLLVDQDTHLQSRERVQPNKYERVLDNLKVDYPGYEIDLSATRDAIVSDSKSNILRMFRKMKEKQRVYDHYLNKNGSNGIDSLELKRSGSDKETRDISEDMNDNNNPPGTKKEDVFRDKIEENSLDKEDVYLEDRSHPNLVALDSLILTYPCWEDDVQDARSVHYYKKISLFQDKVHSLKVKQDLHVGDRSHWRLNKIDDLDLTYPEWEKDLEQVEDWHIHNTDNRENTIFFHEVIEGMLDQQYIYLSWDHEQIQNPFPDIDKIEAQIVHYRGSDDTKVVGQIKPSVNKSEKKNTDKIMDEKNKISENRSHIKYNRSSSKPNSNEERREPETENNRSRSITSSFLPSSSSSPRQKAYDNSSLPQSGPPPKITVLNLGKCDICTTRAKTHLFVPCGHLGCAACSHHSLRTTARCPTCNKPADKVVRIELLAPKKK